MTNHARAAAEAALRARHLDRTLTSALPLQRVEGAAATAVERLDACLGGGLPRGQLSEIAGPPSSGRTTLVLQLIAAATARGELAALVDTFDGLDVTSAAATGADLDRVLWIRGHPITHEFPLQQATEAQRHREQSSPCLRVSVARDRHGLVDRALERGLKALNLVLQAGGFGVAVMDLADAPLAAVRRIPFTTWLRVQRTIEGRDTACVLVVPQPLARSAGGLTLSLAGRARWEGAADRSRRLAGADITVRVMSPRRGWDADIAFAATVADHGTPRHGGTESDFSLASMSRCLGGSSQ